MLNRGLLFLKFIIDESYVEDYIKYIEYGYSDVNLHKINIPGKNVKRSKAKLFEEIVSLPILFCTLVIFFYFIFLLYRLPGFKFLIKPNGWVEQQHNKYLTKSYNYQQLTTRYFGHYKRGFILTKHQNYLDEIGLYHCQLDYGPILTFMYLAPNEYDYNERYEYIRLKSILLGGSDNIIETLKKKYDASFDIFYQDIYNIFESYKEFYKKNKISDIPNKSLQHIYFLKEYKNWKLKKMTNFLKKNKWKFDHLNKIDTSANAILALNKLLMKLKEKHSKYKDIIIKLVYKFGICYSKKKWEYIKLKSEKLNIYWTSKTTICYRKKIAKIVNNESSKKGTDKLFFEVQGINLYNILNLSWHEFDCKYLHDKVYKLNDQNYISIYY